MQEALQEALNSLVERIPPSSLKRAREALSKIYGPSGSSSEIFRDEAMRLAYLASRMPATYEAAKQVLQLLPFSPKQIFDMGAGPGTASWAACELFPDLEKCTLIEKNREMISLGKLLAAGHPLLSQAVWRCETAPKIESLADVSIFSYSLGEMATPSEWIVSWWKSPIPFLVVIEPGSPRGFSLIRKIRDQIFSLGGSVLAPCCHCAACPMQGGDWCHFSSRVQRTRLQRYLKEGSLGYEDEKYSYLIASRNAVDYQKARILRRPQKLPGRVLLTLCAPSGKLESACITKSDRDAYKEARNLEWGDIISIPK